MDPVNPVREPETDGSVAPPDTPQPSPIPSSELPVSQQPIPATPQEPLSVSQPSPEQPALVPEAAQPQPAQPPAPEAVGTPNLFNPAIPRGQLGNDIPADKTNYAIPTNHIDSMSFNSVKKRRFPRKIAFLIILLIALMAGGVVFGYVLPNQPANVYKTGMSRTGKAFSTLVTDATEKSTLDKFAQSDVTASLSAELSGASYSGTLATKYDETGTNGSLVVKSTVDGKQQDYSLKFIGQIIKEQTYPTAFVQLNGLKDLGFDAFIPGLSNYDGKWITIDQEYFKSLGLDSYVSEKNELTAAEIGELTRAAVKVTQERVFTTDEKLAVFEKKKELGKETVDEISAYHFEMGVNQQHLNDYCKAVIDAVMSTPAYKKVPFYKAESFDSDKSDAKKTCDETTRDVKSSDTFDLWIDAKYKLVYKARFTDKDNKNTYIDVGQKYTGGDDVELFVHLVEDKNKVDGRFTLKTNLKSSETSATLNVEAEGDEFPFKLDLTLTAKLFSGTIDTKAPAGTIKLQDVLNQLGINPTAKSNEIITPTKVTQTTTPSSNASTTSTDTKSKLDINSLHARLEEYYNENGYYPSLANLKSTAWRTSNLPGLQFSNTTYTVGGIAESTQYGYSATSCSGDQCQHYSLAATLSNEVYSKQSLN